MEKRISFTRDDPCLKDETTSLPYAGTRQLSVYMCCVYVCGPSSGAMRRTTVTHMDDEALCASAVLAAALEGAPQCRRYCLRPQWEPSKSVSQYESHQRGKSVHSRATRLIQVGVVADDERIFAAQLEHHRRQCLRGRRHHPPAHLPSTAQRQGLGRQMVLVSDDICNAPMRIVQATVYHCDVHLLGLGSGVVHRWFEIHRGAAPRCCQQR